MVEYLNGVQVAAGSNPVTPTTSRQAFVACRVLFAQNTAARRRSGFACSDFFKSKKSIAASLLLLYPKRSRLLRLCPYKCGHNASAALPTFWEPCACLTNLSVFREPCVYGAFFLLKPLWLAAASERTSLCSDFCSRKNQSPAASFLLFRKQVRCATTFLRVCACGAFYTQIFNCIVTVCVVGGRLLYATYTNSFTNENGLMCI